MDYALFKGLDKIGIFPNREAALEAIKGPGIWNICMVVPVNGRLELRDRETIVI